MKQVTIEVFKKLLARRIKQLRNQAELTQSSLAVQIGFKDKQVINNYEVNGANPTAYNLALLAKALNVTIDDMLDFNKLEDQ